MKRPLPMFLTLTDEALAHWFISVRQIGRDCLKRTNRFSDDVHDEEAEDEPGDPEAFIPYCICAQCTEG